MSANFLCGLLQFYMNRVFVFVHQCFFHLLGHRAVRIQILVIRHLFRIHLSRSQTIFFNRIFACIPISTHQLIHTTVRTGSHNIMLNQHRFSVFSTNNCCCLITILEIFHFFTSRFFYNSRTIYSLGIHCNQIIDTVSVFIRSPR